MAAGHGVGSGGATGHAGGDPAPRRQFTCLIDRRLLLRHVASQKRPQLLEIDAGLPARFEPIESLGHTGEQLAEKVPLFETRVRADEPDEVDELIVTDRVILEECRYRGGMEVDEVQADSPAADQGIRRGDVLVGLHVWETISPKNVEYILNRPEFTGLSRVKFYVLRGEETLYGYLPK